MYFWHCIPALIEQLARRPAAVAAIPAMDVALGSTYSRVLDRLDSGRRCWRIFWSHETRYGSRISDHFCARVDEFATREILVVGLAIERQKEKCGLLSKNRFCLRRNLLGV